MPSSHHIVVVGGGVAGLAIASKLKRTAGRIPIAVSLIDREPAYVWKPMLHAIAAGTSDFSQQETNYIAQARDRHFVFHPGELKGIDRDAQMLLLGPLMIEGRSIVPERTISYDTLILATGSQANDFARPASSSTAIWSTADRRRWASTGKSGRACWSVWRPAAPCPSR